MPHPHLAKAPIVEGLIDIQVRPGADKGLEKLSALRDSLKTSYSSAVDLHAYQAQVKLDEGRVSTEHAESQRIGYRLERQAPPFVLLLRKNGFTCSRLTPYDNWESLVAEARPRFDQYCAAVGPKAVTRVATRFINRIEMPTMGLDFEDYLAAPVGIPKGLPEELAHFFTRIVVPHRETAVDIAISQVLEAPNLQTGQVPLLMDIDVYKNVDFPVGSSEPWELLETMRDLKNQAFFGSLTEKALDLFK